MYFDIAKNLIDFWKIALLDLTFSKITFCLVWLLSQENSGLILAYNHSRVSKADLSGHSGYYSTTIPDLIQVLFDKLWGVAQGFMTGEKKNPDLGCSSTWLFRMSQKEVIWRKNPNHLFRMGSSNMTFLDGLMALKWTT